MRETFALELILVASGEKSIYTYVTGYKQRLFCISNLCQYNELNLADIDYNLHGYWS